MAAIKISSRVEEQVWEELRMLAKESHQNVSGLLTEAISDYLQRRAFGPLCLITLQTP
jgi:predicted transcriptional regulator